MTSTQSRKDNFHKVSQWASNLFLSCLSSRGQKVNGEGETTARSGSMPPAPVYTRTTGVSLDVIALKKQPLKIEQPDSL